MANISIWSPRWHDRKVLIAKYKVIAGENEIVFTKAKNLEGKVFTMSGAKIASYPLETNGTISCFAVDFDALNVKESN
jgi:hypothetical protein